MDMKTVFIDADLYSKILFSTSYKREDWGQWAFELDEEMGLELIGKDTDVYSFRITNEKRWMIAKIKYGL
jgi:hypothetical protein